MAILIGNDSGNNLPGGAGNDVIFGLGGNDTLNGNGGNDAISAGSGSDTVDGGLNNDVIDGGSGNDVLFGNSGDDTIDGEDGNDTVNGGTGNDTLNGNGGNDTVNGGTGNDILNGGTGNDTLTGGNGTDTLNGTSGNDVFDFNAAAESPAGLGLDLIVGFNGAGAAAGDLIDLQGVFAGVLAFQGTGAFTAAGQVRVTESGFGNTIVEVNLVGGAAPEMQILIVDGGITAATSYTAADFIL